MKKLLVTGSSGLIGSELCTYFGWQGWQVHGIDNNMRAAFFGPAGDTRPMKEELLRQLPNFYHHELDIRDRQSILAKLAEIKPDAVIHTAAQPSHDKAASIPFEDFDINATGTLNLLESLRQVSTNIPFIHLSTNKVYGDRPNQIPLQESALRWDFNDPEFEHGIPENLRNIQP